MKAVGYFATEDGSSADLVDIDLPEPVPGDGDAKVLGYDAAGLVESVGSAVELFKPGDAVFYAGDITRPGTNSELHAVDERIVGRKPTSLDFAEAAALPLTGITAWEALFDRLGISKTGNDAGRSILIIGAAGGVGSIAVQLAKRVAKLNVIGTASREESSQWARQCGADIVIDHRKPIDAELIAAGLASVDYILCANSTDAHWEAMANAIAPQGSICALVDTAPVDLNLLKRKSVSFSWEFMFTRPMHETSDLIEQHRLLDEIADLVDRKELITTLKKTIRPINAANLRKAHASIKQGNTLGKVVLADWS